MHNMYTIYMVWRSTTSNYNQSEILNYLWVLPGPEILSRGPFYF